jgi:hypothetical protein
LVAYAAPDRAQGCVLIGGDEVARWTLESSTPCHKELLLSSKVKYPFLTFMIPNAVSPRQRGDSNDPRALALALVSATICSG